MSAGDLRFWIEERREELVGLLCELIAIDSVTGREGPLAEHLAAWMGRHGIEARLLPAKGRHNLVGAVGAGARTLVISGHLDTVPPNEGRWTRDPWTPVVEDGLVYGLGASDMHASLVAACFAQRYLIAAHPELPGRVLTAFTIEEETTGDGTRLFLEGALADGLLDPAHTSCVVTEPTGLRQLVLGNRGTTFLHLEVEGLGGHGSRPHLARSPIARLRALLDGLEELQARWGAACSDPDFGAPTLTPTCVAAGAPDRVNVIPQTARAVVDCRVTPALFEDGFARFDAELGAHLATFEQDGYVLSWERRYTRGGQRIAPEHPLVRQALAALREDLGIADVELHYTPAGNDAVFFAARGIPTINKLGPGLVEQCHRVDEHVPVENVLRGVELYVRLAERHLGLG